MYIIDIDAVERNYLLSVLNGKRGVVATGLTTKLRETKESFGVVAWTDDDISAGLVEEGLEPTAENIKVVRQSYYARHVSDHMIKHGWNYLEQALLELRGAEF